MKKRIILIIEDDEAVQELTATHLKLADSEYEVSSAFNGADGLKLAEATKPDLVVLDLMMPGIHGFEVCRRLKESENTKNAKIIITSAKSYAQDMNTAKSLGVEAYFVKPYNFDDFITKVREVLGG